MFFFVDICGVKWPAAGTSRNNRGQASAAWRHARTSASILWPLVASICAVTLRLPPPPLPSLSLSPINIGSAVANLIWIYFKAIKPPIASFKWKAARLLYLWNPRLFGDGGDRKMTRVEVQTSGMTKIHGVPSARLLEYCILRYIIVLSTQVELRGLLVFSVAGFIPPSGQKQFPINVTLFLPRWYKATAIFCCVNDKKNM